MAISSGNGFLFSGDRCLTRLVMNTSSRWMPFSAKTLFRNFPARPMKGLPVLSSSAPGFCPTSMSSALAGPSPGTGCLVFCHSLHFRQICIFLFMSSRVNWVTFVVGL